MLKTRTSARLLIGAAAAMCCLTGSALAQPANDLCENALPVDVPSSTAANLLGSTIEGGPPQTCGTAFTTSGGGVWFTIVGNGNALTVNTCTGGNAFDTKLHVYCSDSSTPCAAVTTLSCVTGNDDFSGCGTGFTLRSSVTFCSALGQTYHILVTAFASTTAVGTGAFNLNVLDSGLPCSVAGSCTPTAAGACCNSSTQACTVVANAGACTGSFQGAGTSCTYASPCPGVGACCTTTGTCSITLPANCTGTNTHLGAGTSCQPTNACTAILGACCNNTTQACTNVTSAGCAAGTSTFQGPGTVCGVNLCTGTGACCSTTGVCTVVLPANCTGSSVHQGVGTTCLPVSPCAAFVGACCTTTGTCSLTLPANCTGSSTHLGLGTACLPINACTAILGACCNNTTQACTNVTSAGCAAGTSTFRGPGTVCGLDLCTGTGACCSSTGTCTVTLPANCTGTSLHQGVGTTCLPSNPCFALLRVCCSSSGTCSLTTAPACTGTSTFLSAQAACLPLNPCASSNGACCNNTTGSCTSTTPAGCNLSTSTFLGSGTVCGVDLCPNVGACCSDLGLCTLTAAGGCTAGSQTFLGAGVLCTPTNPCTAILRACCSATGTCQLKTVRGCGSTFVLETPLPEETACTPANPCSALLRACCGVNQACQLRTPRGCSGYFVFLPDELSCSPTDPCQPFVGACCSAEGFCEVRLQFACTNIDVTFLGLGTVCAPVNPCTDLLRACCVGEGECLLQTPRGCTTALTGGVSFPELTTCTPANLCAATLRACCAFGSCFLVVSEEYCRVNHSGQFVSTNTTCEPFDLCFTTTGVCCRTNGVCVITTPDACMSTHGGVFRADFTSCTPTNSCATLFGACCGADGLCNIQFYTQCPTFSTSIGFQGIGTTCTPNPCLAFVGACCETSGNCFVTVPTECFPPRGFLGLGTSCLPNPCGGACCTGTSCSTAASSAQCAGFFIPSGACSPTNPCAGACCTAGSCLTTPPPEQGGCAGGVFQGVGSPCFPNPCGGACCTGGTCTITAAPSDGGCAGGTFFGIGSTCFTGICTGACCVGTSCSVVSPTACSGDFKGLRSVCTPTPCPGVSAPSNDECANAIDIPNDVLPAITVATNANASTDPSPAICVPVSRDVWFTFTPAISQDYSVFTCGGVTGTLDTVLSIHSACPTPLANNLVPGPNCDDDNCSGTTGPSFIPVVNMQAGTTYWIRVSRWGTSGAGGQFTLTIDEIRAPCCNTITGACTMRTQAACAGTGLWLASGVCVPTNPCVGRCCASDGSCSLITVITGCPAGTTYGGVGTTCDPNTCTIPTGACCDAEGLCSVVVGTECGAGSTFAGPGTACEPGICTLGACLLDSPPCEPCSITIAPLCSGGVFIPGGSCTPPNDPCDAPIALTLGVAQSGTLCRATLETGEPAPTCQSSHSRSVWYAFTPSHSAAYDFSTCGIDFDSVLSLYSGACDALSPVACDDDACDGVSPPGNIFAARISGAVLSAGETYLVRVSRFGTGLTGNAFTLIVTNTAPLGACCANDTSCTLTDEARCDALFFSDGVCDPNTCPPPEGACCCGSSCTVTLPADCTGPNQSFAGRGTACTPYSATIPCCRGDFDQSGIPPSIEDLFEFLAFYFRGDLCADTNDSGVLSVQDLFDFLISYFDGCN